MDDKFFADLAAGRLTGFVTLKGGRETKKISKVPFDAAAKFGFCVQRYAPTPSEVSQETLRQVMQTERLASLTEAKEFVASQAPRTLTSGTFHVWETVSTSYLRWLMNERGFREFKVRHLMLYAFSDYPRHFLEPLLQRRHEAKLAGNSVAAECLKLLGNGSFGYNGLEATNYSSVRLVTQERLAQLRRRQLAPLSLKAVTLVGVIRVKKRVTSRRGRNSDSLGRGAAFLDAEARDDDNDNDVDDDDDEDFLTRRSEEQERREVLGLVDNDDDDDDNDGYFCSSDLEEDGNETSATTALLTGASSDEAVKQQDEKVFACESNERVNLTSLYSVEVSGKTRRIFNNLPKAVAVLSNSKRLFFSHLAVMLECLDPRLAELCYIDTDSCVWSLTYQNIEDCLLESKQAVWKSAQVLADEKSPHSCHGKMKLEGTYRAGLFKTNKIYRLFGDLAYTRCKGVNRRAAERLENRLFDPSWTGVAVVHKSSLRPTRTGEIVIAKESRTLAKPYNFKRHVTPGGVHTLPFSDVAVRRGEPPDDQQHH